MSLYKDASLVMIPSAYKDGKLYSIRPTDGSGDFTFSRGSNLAATRVDVNGLIEKGRENILLQSNKFDTTWVTAANSSVTSGQADKDGGTDAWLLESTATSSSMRLQQDVSSSSILTYSVYAKAGTTDWLILRSNASNTAVWFDLTNGVIGQENINAIDSSIESVGNGWYRLSVVFSSCTSVRFYVADGDGSFAITLGANVYIQDAQLEAGLVATDYIETGASTAQAGILEDMPRLDYSGGASCPALLLEPQRTNSYVHSEYFSGAGWTMGRSAVTYNDATSPEGIANAVRWQMTSDTGAHYLRQSKTSTDTWSVSIFVKKGNYRYIGLRCAASNAAFDLDTGTFSSGSGYVEALENGWYRIGLTETANGTFQYYGIYYANSNATERNDATGDEYYHIYGAQLEIGSYPTSYIPTYGSSVTRSGEGRVNRLASPITFAAGENFTLYFEGEFNPLNPLPMLMGGRTTSNAYWWITSNTGLNGKLSSNSGTEMATYTGGSITPYTRHKFLVKRDSNVITFYQDGVALTTTQGSGVADAWTFQSLGYGFNDVGSYSFSGKAYQAAIFPTALTDSECIALTTL